MTSAWGNSWKAWIVLATGVALIPVVVWAADGSARRGRADRVQAPAEVVEMFQAIKDGKIEVKLIPKDSKQSNVLIENKTDKPLRVQLPEAFAGVPVLAQAGLAGPGGGLGGLGGLGAGGLGAGGFGGGQGFGGGFGGLGGFGGGVGGLGGFGGGGLGGGFFNVPPEKVGKLQVTTVCLEHGKPEPTPKMKYEIRPIEAFTDKAEVRELCRMLGAGLIDQRAAQAAAWHLNCNMSWQQLATKQLRFANGLRRPYFTPAELRRAVQAAAMASQLAEQRRQETGADSLSQR